MKSKLYDMAIEGAKKRITEYWTQYHDLGLITLNEFATRAIHVGRRLEAVHLKLLIRSKKS